MKTLYEKILEKPKTYRRRLSYIATALIGVLVFTVWLVITSYSMKEAFNFGENIENIENLAPNKTESPSFYDEQDKGQGNMKSFEQNFEKLMNSEKEEVDPLETE